MRSFICEICLEPFESDRNRNRTTCSVACRSVKAGRGNRKGTPAERFWSRVQIGPAQDCWPWLGILRSDGYGEFCLAESAAKVRAHRFAYELLVGPIPDDTELDHICSTPSCVNPAHLEPVSHAENNRRISQRGRHWAQKRSHCPNGHQLAGNTRPVHRSNGSKETICVTCERDRRSRYALARGPKTWASLDAK